MAITYDAPSNTITIVGGPYNFTDVYNADVAGGWGKVHLQGTIQFMIDAKLIIGDAVNTTTFADTGKQVYFTLTGGVIYVSLRKKSTTTFGTLNDATKKTSNNGCHFMFASSGWAWPFQVYSGDATVYFYLYSCVIEFPNVSSGGVAPYVEDNSGLAIVKIYNCVLDRAAPKNLGSACDIYNIQVTNGYYALNSMNAPCDVAFINGAKYAIYGFQNIGDVVSNFVVRNCITKFFLQDGGSGSRHLVNFDVDSWNFTWNNSPTGKIYRQYTFDLKVTDKDNNNISGATVSLVDKNGTSIFSVTTAADGTIAQQTVSRGYYAAATGDTLQEYSPHTLTVSKSDYQTYVKTFTLGAKTVWEIKLAKWSQILFANGNPVLNIVPTDPENKIVLGL